MSKRWIFTKPLTLTVVRIKGHHYLNIDYNVFLFFYKTKIGFLNIKEARDLKQLRLDVKKGKYAEFYNAPITDQLWAILAQKTGLMRLVEEEEDDES